MALFSLYISFCIVVYIIYKKIVPLINAYVGDYQNKINTTLRDITEERMNLTKELAELNQQEQLLAGEIDKIIKDGQQKILNLKQVQSKTLADMLQTKQSITQYHLKTLQERAEQTARLKIAQDVSINLKTWAIQEINNDNLQKIISIKKIEQMGTALK
jgi:F0F1-type ATP synthase membrane subunit b/b'